MPYPFVFAVRRLELDGGGLEEKRPGLEGCGVKQFIERRRVGV